MATQNLYYPYKRISSLEALGKVLNCSPKEILKLCKNAECLYSVFYEQKKSNGYRKLVRVNHQLQAVQKKIHLNILKKVIYPTYLIGSISGRDAKTNAQAHCHSKILFKEDIANFFPNITVHHVFDIWKNFFKFEHNVALCLTRLTTFRGALPQGTSTSPLLANLVLYKRESSFNQWCCNNGLTYTRFVDDISISARGRIDPKMKTMVLNKLCGMLISMGFQIKRSKHAIETSRAHMTVMNIGINRTQATVSHQYRKKLRAEICQLQKTQYSEKSLLSTQGKVNHVKRYHPNYAQKLQLSLNEVKQLNKLNK